MVPSVTGHGYFMVASDGGVFAFGDAHFAGSCPGIGGCSGQAVAVVPDATGNGYWVVTKAGAVYGFGDAAVFRGTGTPELANHFRGCCAERTVAITSSTARARCSPMETPPGCGGTPPESSSVLDPTTAIFATADGGGYWITTALGEVYAFGDAPNDGDESGAHLNGPIIAATGW